MEILLGILILLVLGTMKVDLPPGVTFVRWFYPVVAAVAVAGFLCFIFSMWWNRYS